MTIGSAGGRPGGFGIGPGAASARGSSGGFDLEVMRIPALSSAHGRRRRSSYSGASRRILHGRLLSSARRVASCLNGSRVPPEDSASLSCPPASE
jgi:hypothetical protein